MVIARLNGGLGNQLFQYAAGFALAKKNGCEFKIDLSSFGQEARNTQDAVRTPDILQFLITANLASASEVELFRNPMGFLSRGGRFISQRVLKRYNSDWHPEIMLQSGNIYLEGYFQCENYFIDCINQLLREFTLKQDLLRGVEYLSGDIKRLDNPVSLHIRRGDYVSNPRASKLHNICTISYYQKALAELELRVGKFNLVVFSDDIDWARKNLNLEKGALYVSEKTTSDGEKLTAPQEITLMSHCHHHVISNSTFSWWGAYLNRRPQKIVVAPSLWNRSKINRHRNILPPSWLQAPVA